jgi:hypothetical protein
MKETSARHVLANSSAPMVLRIVVNINNWY